ncbi:hypothetical protein HanXRQr2_Chr11g0514911 [Helianthus annuus]|uniref:Uncharacterized protein n=1 Tax=Helianthus annuus TaxID=4232 RepID=A0A9K3HT42_HELAN|nr:hypothetical protein HanXRQr2_Chr11g0514911 [Helianthus annuus]
MLETTIDVTKREGLTHILIGPTISLIIYLQPGSYWKQHLYSSRGSHWKQSLYSYRVEIRLSTSYPPQTLPLLCYWWDLLSMMMTTIYLPWTKIRVCPC